MYTVPVHRLTTSAAAAHPNKTAPFFGRVWRMGDSQETFNNTYLRATQ